MSNLKIKRHKTTFKSGKSFNVMTMYNTTTKHYTIVTDPYQCGTTNRKYKAGFKEFSKQLRILNVLQKQ